MPAFDDGAQDAARKAKILDIYTRIGHLEKSISYHIKELKVNPDYLFHRLDSLRVDYKDLCKEGDPVYIPTPDYEM